MSPELRRSATARLAAAGVADPQREVKRLWDLAAEQKGTPDEAFEAFLMRRVKREPFSHLAGRRLFWKHSFAVNASVLDPRPETETLIATALEEPFKKVLDLGTGSGCIVISLLAERPEARGVGSDISSAALLTAGRNAEAIGVAERLILPESDWFQDLGGRYDVITSNPPYIATHELEGLAPETRFYEPIEALTDHADGLSAYRILAERAPDHLVPGGRLIVEVGLGQAPAVAAIFQQSGFRDIRFVQDLDGRDRVVQGRLAPLL